MDFLIDDFVEADGVRYIGFWPGFKPENFLLHKFLRDSRESPLCVVGPYIPKKQRDSMREFVTKEGKADFFITGENRLPEFEFAVRQIGFWRSFSDNNLVLRFPNWMWLLDWPEIENQPSYDRYGCRLSINRLMSPITALYDANDLGNRRSRAILFATHLREPRERFFKLVDKVVGCDGLGKAFQMPVRGYKMSILERYAFCLCPENSLGDGYVTEKIPDAFHAGCIPITWCNPEDLAEDFNPEAVINLFGLSDDEIVSVIQRLLWEPQFVAQLRGVPLLKHRPSLEYLYSFLDQKA
jgi:hypothetical protein